MEARGGGGGGGQSAAAAGGGEEERGCGRLARSGRGGGCAVDDKLCAESESPRPRPTAYRLGSAAVIATTTVTGIHPDLRRPWRAC
eukprot:3379299-Rhodomonas_salina.1